MTNLLLVRFQQHYNQGILLSVMWCCATR